MVHAARGLHQPAARACGHSIPDPPPSRRTTNRNRQRNDRRAQSRTIRESRTQRFVDVNDRGTPER